MNPVRMLIGLALGGATLMSSPAISEAPEEPDQALRNPPAIGRVATEPGNALEPVPQEVSVGLSIAYRDGTIWNPDTQRHDAVRLRSYRSGDLEPSGFFGPTIVARPGDTLRVELTNNLPVDDPSCGVREDHKVSWISPRE